MRAKSAMITAVAVFLAALAAACSASPEPPPPTSSAPSSTASSSTFSPSPPASSTSASAATSPSTSSDTSPSTPASSAAPGPADPLTGRAPSTNPVVAVKIDNTAGAFPQFGIASADIVYVEQVEGGLTRLIALFHTTLPTAVGPVRSVRTTDVELLQTYGDPLLVYSGGKTAILKLLRASPIVDAAGSGYHRTGQRPPPYNLIADLPQIAARYPGKAAAKSNGMVFAASDPRVAAAPVVTKISATMIAGQTGFAYANGSYRVLHHGVPYQDASGEPVAADNVLVQHVLDAPDGFVDVLGSPSFLTHTVGSGAFTLYRNGHAIDGTWKRAAAGEATEFLDAKGNPVPFKPGRTWVVLAPQTAVVHAS